MALESLRRQLEVALSLRREAEEEGARLKAATEVGLTRVLILESMSGLVILLTVFRRVFMLPRQSLEERVRVADSELQDQEVLVERLRGEVKAALKRVEEEQGSSP